MVISLAMGRPRLPAYRGKQIRLGTIEDRLKELISDLERDEDKKKVSNIIKELKGENTVKMG